MVKINGDEYRRQLIIQSGRAGKDADAFTWCWSAGGPTRGPPFASAFAQPSDSVSFRFPPSSLNHFHHLISLPLGTTVYTDAHPRFTTPESRRGAAAPSCGVARPRILALYAVHRNQLHPIIHHPPRKQTLIHHSSLAPAFNP